jgi:hypothetical protein
MAQWRAGPFRCPLVSVDRARPLVQILSKIRYQSLADPRSSLLAGVGNMGTIRAGMEPVKGVEPLTYGLRNRCSASELHRLKIKHEIAAGRG